jgi:hypothetical protein
MGIFVVRTVYADHMDAIAKIALLGTKPPCPACDPSKNPPIQVIIPPMATKESPFPCDYAMNFTQTESSNSLGPNPFSERVEFIPKKFDVKGDTHVASVVLFYANKNIVSGAAQGVMKDQYTGDPLAAGISIATGNAGVVTRNGVAELWISDEEKFLKAKKVVVDLHGPERFRVLCVKQLVVTNRYITIPNAGPSK